MSFINWAEKYRPSTLSEIIGNDKAVEEIKQWVDTLENRGKKAAIFYGPAGVGKTSAAHALARGIGWDVIELNASDQRTAEVVKRIAGTASKSGTFFGTAGKRLVILDEADNLHGTADRGGARAIIEVIKQTNQPIILIANDLYALSPAIRALCRAIQFRAIQGRSIMSALKRICQREDIKCEEKALLAIAENSRDLRSAINDLQAIAQGRDSFLPQDVVVGKRDFKETIFQIMADIFKGRDLKKPLYAAYDLDESPEDLIHWIDENLPRAYAGEDIGRGFKSLSKADVYLGRVKRRQSYALWSFASEMMICGVQNAKKKEYRSYTQYSPPTRWRKLSQTKSAREVRDSAAEKIARYCHTSERYVRSEMLSLFKLLMQKEELAVAITALLQFEEEEVAFLLDSKKDSKKVKNIFNAAQEILKKQMEERIEVFGGFKNAGAEESTQVEAEEPEEEKEVDPAKQRTLFEF